MTTTRTAPSDRDRALIHVAYSLGWATQHALHELVCPAMNQPNLWRRLQKLVRSRYLVRVRYSSSKHAHPYLYGVGRGAIAPGAPRPWRPGLAHLEHTLAVCDTLLRLTDPTFHPPLRVTSWQGEAEIRGWIAPGHPRADLIVDWEHPSGAGRWHVEVDRGTESLPVWRNKLRRYAAYSPGATVLAITTSERRARNLTEVGAQLGVRVVAAADVRALLTPPADR